MKHKLIKNKKKESRRIPIQKDIVLFKTRNGKTAMEVRLKKETVWLNQKQISQLFQVERSVITKHLGNIFSSSELVEKSNVQKMHIAFSDKPVKFYNLDVIISVGYRVNSKMATQFRIWATKVLKNYLVNGYVVNKKRLHAQQEKFNELQKTISFLQKKTALQEIKSQAEEIFSILNSYASSMTLLFQYDKGKVPILKTKKPKYKLTYESALDLIVGFKRELIAKREATNIFGKEVNKKLHGILGSIYQTFDRKDLYPSIEEKAANLLYFIIKDHPFVDGNKRIGSILFVHFLGKNNFLLKKSGEKKISDTTLVALALLIAISVPTEKNIMVSIITNLLKG